MNLKGCGRKWPCPDLGRYNGISAKGRKRDHGLWRSACTVGERERAP
jgi:hypothetical protein